MPEGDKEIEINVPVDEDTFESVERRMESAGTFDRALEHEDTYYTPPHEDFLKPEYPYQWLSLRERGGETILNYKHLRPEGAKDPAYRDEYETAVEDGRALRNVLEALGYEELVTVAKRRDVYVYGKFEVGLDVVESLGTFVEIEAREVIEDVATTNDELTGLATELGLDPAERSYKGYPHMLLEQRR